MGERITIKDTEYDVVHRFGDARVIIDMGGVYALADLNSTVGDPVWELSGRPARDGEEKQVLGALVKKLEEQGTVVKVERD